jgi:hypothetical protein
MDIAPQFLGVERFSFIVVWLSFTFVVVGGLPIFCPVLVVVAPVTIFLVPVTISFAPVSVFTFAFAFFSAFVSAA